MRSWVSTTASVEAPSASITFDANCGLTTDDTRLDVPYSRALLHFYALPPRTHGGTVPYGFSGPAAVRSFVSRGGSPVPIPPVERYWGLMRDNARLTHPKARASLLTDLAVFGTHYENILLFGASASNRALLLDRGYIVDFEHGSFVNAHYAPCAVELVSDVLPADPPVLVRGGIRQDELWSNLQAGPNHKQTCDQGIVEHGMPADIWVRVQWQNSEQRCANADAHGRIALHAEHGTTRVVCERNSTP